MSTSDLMTAIRVLFPLVLAAARLPVPGTPLDAQSPPRLVVVLVVDQMRADYLDRFGAQWTGGLARLLSTGAVFRDAHQDHAHTSTAPGHAALVTGLFPSRSGIVGNNWYDRDARREVYSVEDTTVAIVGFPNDAGRSPRLLLHTTLGDWLKAASPQSSVFAVAIKDRSAVTLGGFHADGVYWYHRDSGRFVTSTYYRPDYPWWVGDFNRTGPAAYFGHTWSRLLPDPAYAVSREDSFPPESDGVHSTFPHVLNGRPAPDADFFRSTFLHTPFADLLTLRFVQTLVEQEGVGRGAHPDLLLVGLSAADYVGHAYGPYSQEVQDHFLRLDAYLGAFFEFLNGTVGADRYVVALSSDHGVLPMPEELQRRGIWAGRVTSSQLRAVATEAFTRALDGHERAAWPRLEHVAGGFVLDLGDLPATEARRATLRDSVAAGLRTMPEVDAAYTYDLLGGSGWTDDPYIEAFRRSFHPDRAPDVVVRLRENVLVSSGPWGTTHGSPYRYDTHVPLIFAGPGVRAGFHDTRARTVDLAPTLAVLLALPMPDGLDGRDLLPVTGR